MYSFSHIFSFYLSKYYLFLGLSILKLVDYLNCESSVNIIRGVLGNKCADNLKTVKIREIVWKQNIQQILFCIETLLRAYPLDELLRQQRLLKVSD